MSAYALIRCEPGALSNGCGAYVHLACVGDASPAHRTYPVGYDSRCGWCWLNAPHTVDAHSLKVAEQVAADLAWSSR